MKNLAIECRRFTLRDFIEADRPAFVAYQTDPRYRQLYDFDGNSERPNQLFDLFLRWQRERPRMNMQVAICDSSTGQLLGCGGLRRRDDDVAVLGIELAPSQWGRFRLALDAATALLRYGFHTLNLAIIIGETASGNIRVEKLARRLGAELVRRRPGPDWMQARGWQEVDWSITRERWETATAASLAVSKS